VSLLSKSCEYSLRAVLYVAAQKGNAYVSIRAMAGELGVSFYFLTKLMKKLTDHGVLKSSRGPKGGVVLARPAEKIHLYDILQAAEGHALFRGCVLGLAGCGERKPCPLHKQWAIERNRLERMFRSTTLARGAALVANGALRLSD